MSPSIHYPCEWLYTVIGEDEGALRKAIDEIVSDRKHTISVSKKSKTGKYTSLLLEVFVMDEEERKKIFNSLQKHGAVKIVIKDTLEVLVTDCDLPAPPV